ncbi:hypothetical protein T02_16157 [Trichinella nativa]|uniref:Uncharacterized protein n=1 Tax=Trichinella nativa TaxID=6335 RepID=A0A0V1LFE8_9BILA|nr:hypothetical protein T02_16157 [Trichinella nativa]
MHLSQEVHSGKLRIWNKSTVGLSASEAGSGSRKKSKSKKARASHRDAKADDVVHNQIHVIDRVRDLVRDHDLVRTLLHEDFNLKLSTDSIKLLFIAECIV